MKGKLIILPGKDKCRRIFMDTMIGQPCDTANLEDSVDDVYLKSVRKEKIIYIDELRLFDVIRQMLASGRSQITINSNLQFERLPGGCKLEFVYHEPKRRAFAFVVSHGSFDYVEEGEIAPEIKIEI